MYTHTQREDTNKQQEQTRHTHRRVHNHTHTHTSKTQRQTNVVYTTHKPHISHTLNCIEEQTQKTSRSGLFHFDTLVDHQDSAKRSLAWTKRQPHQYRSMRQHPQQHNTQHPQRCMRYHHETCCCWCHRCSDHTLCQIRTHLVDLVTGVMLHSRYR